MGVAHWLTIAALAVVGLALEGLFEFFVPELYHAVVEPRIRALATRRDGSWLLTGLWLVGGGLIWIGWLVAIDRGQDWGLILIFLPVPCLAALTSTWVRTGSLAHKLRPDV